MAGLWRAYANFVQKFPWGSQIAQTGVLLGTGDVISQVVVERKSINDIDIKRVGRFFVMGTCVAAPCMRSWYLLLEKFVTVQGSKAALAKMLLDQSLFAPCFLALFISSATALQGKGVEEIREKLEKDYVGIVATNYKVWPATQLLNFYLVPFQHRILVVNIVGLFWNTYLASRTNNS